MNESKTIIVSNRLPVKIQIKNNTYKYQRSEGGLATGLGSIFQEKNSSIWLGWPGIELEEKTAQDTVRADLKKRSLLPVFLSREEIEQYYEGFSNRTLWPLCHYFPSYASFSPINWDTYFKVNQKFADATLKIARSEDTIWIHDYQLMLVPQMIRDKMPDVRIGFFQHIPFPSYEVFRLIPWREQLLEGLLGANLIGFHTHDDVRHFISSAVRILKISSMMNELQLGTRTVWAEAFPMGIDFRKYNTQIHKPATKNYRREIEDRINGKKLMISIDRLDYSKGILHRLESYLSFFKKYPEFKEKAVFFQLVVPSRDNVKEYKKLRQEINRTVAEINGSLATLSWQPIYYFYKSWPLSMLSALYAAADVALVGPLRDGMNLVSKEYIASKENEHGVLILSEMAGAAKELNEAIIINPMDTIGVAEAIYQAFTMSEEEQKERLANMRSTVQKFDIHLWVHNFMKRLNEAQQNAQLLKTHMITPVLAKTIQSKFENTGKRLIFLDYDGTLMPFQTNPKKSVPDEQLMQLLQDLSADIHSRVVIISGRQKATLESWMGHLDIDIIAEHGAWTKESNGHWHSPQLNNDWEKDVLPILEEYETRTPGSFIEMKDYSIAWHYRKVDPDLGELRAKEIVRNLKYIVIGMGLQILEGNKVVEIKSTSVNKGKAARDWMRKFPSDFLIAIGDDLTDEDTFKAMPKEAITIKVGGGTSAATYYLENPQEVRLFLRKLSGATITA